MVVAFPAFRNWEYPLSADSSSRRNIDLKRKNNNSCKKSTSILFQPKKEAMETKKGTEQGRAYAFYFHG